MMDANGKDNASASIPSPENDSAKTAVTETVVTETVVSLMETNLEETVVVSETEDKVEQIMEEVKTEENAIVLVRTDENATEEENIGADEKEEDEMNVENAEEGKNEENSQEEEEEKENNDKDAMEEEKAEENAIEERNEEKAEASSKAVKKSRKRRRNKVARSDSKTVAAKDKDKPESSGNKTPSKKAKTVAAKDQDEPESSGKKKPSKETKMVAAKDKEEPESLGKKKRSKEAKTVAAKDKDEPESSGKKKPSKKAESMGMIFMCSSKTKKDCYRYKVLGLPASKKDLVQKIYKGMRLFLYDVDLKLMYGIYKAAGPGGFNIEPKAFNSAFPSQVRFTVLEECVPLGEEKFKKVIKNNYYSRNKFDCQLNSEQVKNLCKLFASASKGPKSKKAGRSVRAETHTSAGRGRIRRRVSDESRPRSPGRARRYIDHPVVYEREAFVSPMAPMPHVPLPARVPVPPPSYAYGRTVEMDAYRRDPPPEHRGRQYRDEIGSRDHYVYREREPYRDPVYSAGVPPEYNYVPPAEYNYVPPAALPSQYRYVDPVSEYRSSAGVPAEYHTPAGLRTEYRSSARDRVYRL